MTSSVHLKCSYSQVARISNNQDQPISTNRKVAIYVGAFFAAFVFGIGIGYLFTSKRLENHPCLENSITFNPYDQYNYGRYYEKFCRPWFDFMGCIDDKIAPNSHYAPCIRPVECDP